MSMLAPQQNWSTRAREPIALRRVASREYAAVNRDGQQELLAALCERVSRGECVECLFFHQNKYLFLVGDYKYSTMKECAEFDLDAGDEVPYRDRREFVIRQGDTGK